MRISKLLLCLAGAAFINTSAYGYFLTGEGFYSAKGEMRTKPGFQNDTGLVEVLDQYLRIGTEFRVSDKASFVGELRIFENPRKSYMGDVTAVQKCHKDSTADGSNTGYQAASGCENYPQSTYNPQYKNMTPKFSKYYIQYATDYCILRAGRRGRQLGMGIYLDEGLDVFDTGISAYDGISCDVNIQKTQTLGFSAGYDKVSESQSFTNYYLTDSSSARSDDLNQFFASLTYDDSKANQSKEFKKKIEIYFANIVGGEKYDTNIKYGDIFFGFYFNRFELLNELVFTTGKSADKNWEMLGGLSSIDESALVQNKIQSLASAGSLRYYVSKSGSYLGPAKYSQGNIFNQSIVFEYAYAPGDSDGYKRQYEGFTAQRNKDVEAFAFNQNYKPALIFFNARETNDDMRIDGVFDPFRILNAYLLGLGYEIESSKFGNIKAELFYSSLLQGMPEEVKIATENADTKMVGYYGKDIGYEIDLQYSYLFDRGLELGANLAAAMPGQAWKIKDDNEPENNYLMQGYVTFNF